MIDRIKCRIQRTLFSHINSKLQEANSVIDAHEMQEHHNYQAELLCKRLST